MIIVHFFVLRLIYKDLYVFKNYDKINLYNILHTVVRIKYT